MSSTTPITTIRSAHGGKFISHKVFTAGTPVSAAAKYPYLVYKIAFFHRWAKVSDIAPL
jgi:hypothetical protein